MKTIKTFSEWLNENWVSTRTDEVGNKPDNTDKTFEREREYVYSLSEDQLTDELKKYLDYFYSQDPKLLKADVSYLNWGEYEGDEYLAANYIADLMIEQDTKDLSLKDEDILSFAWDVADEYLKSKNENPLNKLKTIKNLYNYLIKNYEVLGDEKITKGDDWNDWYAIKIPVTLSGDNIVTALDAYEEGKIGAIDFTPNLEEYINEIDTITSIENEAELEELGYIRGYTENDPVLCSDVVECLDKLLEVVPDPALKKK